jgi:hypothetical protein
MVVADDLLRALEAVAIQASREIAPMLVGFT